MLGPLRNFLLGPPAGPDRAIGPILIVATILLGFGLTLPFMTVTRFFVLADEISVIGGIVALAEDGEWFLALVLLSFSVVFPLFKIGAAWLASRRTAAGDEGLKRALRRLEFFSRWSMLDVMVAALAVLSAKVSGIALAVSQPGLYCFFAAVLLSTLAVARLERAAHRAPGNGDGS